MTRALTALALSLALAGPATAQDSGVTVEDVPDSRLNKTDRADEAGSATAGERRAARLDLMFGRLATAEDKRRADRIAANIMRRLTRSDSPTVNYLMAQAAAAMKEKELGLAVDLLNGVVQQAPDFAEGWNRRATVHFMRGDYGRSIADIEQVLKLEPRHWGALSGLAIILNSMEREEEALEVMDRALAVHPHLEKLKQRRDRLARELEGADI